MTLSRFWYLRFIGILFHPERTAFNKIVHLLIKAVLQVCHRTFSLSVLIYESENKGGWMDMKTFNVAVIGGGIAGLVAANELARAGKSVIVLEKSNRFGGRAMTVNKNGACFNLGVHAMYRGGAAEEIFQDLGLEIEGGSPNANGSVLWNNKVIPLSKFILSHHLSWAGKIELVRLLAKIRKIDTSAIPSIRVRDWVEKEIRDPMTRHIFYALFRAGTYTQAPDHQMIGPVLNQVQRSFQKNGALYLRGGWQTIVDQLREKAVHAGVMLMNNKSVTEIEHDGSIRALKFADGESMDISHVISTLPPAEMYRLLPGAENTALQHWKDQARVSVAACLDLCLKRLPQADRNVVIGIDQPVFYTNQSKVTKLSEDGTVVVHIIKHNGTGGTDPKGDERFLEQTMNLIQPGWQKEIVAKQYLPNMTVAFDYMHVDRKDRFPGPAVPEIRGLYVAGEWASHGELLVDSAAASGRRAAHSVLKLFGETVKQVVSELVFV
jgi:phytoene dehydrogenase-like protein